jgi:fatty-acyl-CoA synthase
MVVALVELAPTADMHEDIHEDILRGFVRETLAGYKVPKRVLALESLERAPNGKADYKLLRGIAALKLTGPPLTESTQ